jgi:hypothetical protein
MRNGEKGLVTTQTESRSVQPFLLEQSGVLVQLLDPLTNIPQQLFRWHQGIARFFRCQPNGCA